MKRFQSKFLFFFPALLALASCGDKFLDVEPDNRAELNTEENIIKMLTSAYPAQSYVLMAEMMSDDIDDLGESNPYTARYIEQLYAWEDVTEVYEELPENIWEDAYRAIGSANEALAAIDRMGPNLSVPMQQARAEALLCRAYHHFILVNIFALNYNPATSEQDPGITYITAPEDTPTPKYERQSVAECYRLIEKDVLEALPFVGDLNYSVPKYHFNEKAAYAFAAKFFLFYQKWEESIKYADLCLGSDPQAMLRDWQAYNDMVADYGTRTRNFIDPIHNCNLLLHSSWSLLGVIFGPYTTYKRFSHTSYICEYEGEASSMVWGSPGWKLGLKRYSDANYNFMIFEKHPYLFEYTDPVAGIGYPHTVTPLFTSDETLLIRAEARVLQDKPDYAGALQDLNTWLHNISSTGFVLTKESITDYYGRKKYATWNQGTPKKHFHAAFDTGEEGSDKESMLQFILHMKRVENQLMGQRWFDIKRYGLEIYRRTVDYTGYPVELKDTMPFDDPRRAVQIPQKVLEAGYEPNPRNK